MMKLKLFDFEKYEDYGWEFFLQVLKSSKFALIDLRFQIDEFPATEWFPCVLFGFGPHDVFGFSFRWKWFQFTLNFMNFRPRNLNWYRDGGERYKDID